MRLRTLTLTGSIAFCALTGACGSGDDSANAQQDNPYPKLETKTSAAVETNAADVKWYTDWNEGMAAAKEQDKPVFIHFTADWCKFCVKMKKETYSAGEIKQRFNDSWITIMVDTENRDFKGDVYINEGEKKMLTYLDGNNAGYEEKNLDIRGLTQNFGVSGLPTLVFIDKNGEPLQSIPGFIEKSEFAVILDYFQDGSYKDIGFEEYRKKAGTKS
jgi:thioredoxin-related protein